MRESEVFFAKIGDNEKLRVYSDPGFSVIYQLEKCLINRICGTFKEFISFWFSDI